eukprot:5014798-Prymnesium_polylepis.1
MSDDHGNWHGMHSGPVACVTTEALTLWYCPLSPASERDGVGRVNGWENCGAAPGSWHPRGQPALLSTGNRLGGARSPVDLSRRSRRSQLPGFHSVVEGVRDAPLILVGAPLLVQHLGREACMDGSPDWVSLTWGTQRPCVSAGAVSYTHLTLPTICSV